MLFNPEFLHPYVAKRGVDRVQRYNTHFFNTIVSRVTHLVVVYVLF